MDKKIMLVDDAAFMRMMIKDMLANNGLVAVTNYPVEKPDLVIMDITMPVMDGLEALKQIRGKDPGAKVIMCSAMGQEAMVVDALKHGAKDFIVKPFKADRIMKAVRGLLE